MKKLITSLTILLTVSIVFAGGVFAAINWSGSQDVKEAKEKISLIVNIIKGKDEKIKTLENEKKDFNKQLDNFNKQLDEKNKVIADKDKAIADKEREKVQLENVVIQKENENTQLKAANDNLKEEMGNKAKTYEEQLKQAKQDAQDINKLLGDVVNENK